MAGERTRTVAVRLTPAEHAVWEAAAAAAGRGRLGSWVRDEVSAHLEECGDLGAETRRSRTHGRSVKVAASGDLDVDAVAALARSSTLRAELSRVGNNLNQAVRLAHAQGGEAGALARMEEAAAQVWALMSLVHEQSTRAGADVGAVTTEATANAPAGGGRPGPRRAPRTASAASSTSVDRAQQQGRPAQTAQPVNPWTSGGDR